MLCLELGHLISCRRDRVRGDGRRDEVVRRRRRTSCSLAAQALNLLNRCSSPAHAAARMRRVASARGDGIVVTSRFSASLATRCRRLLVMLASPCRTSELLARARAASGRGVVPVAAQTSPPWTRWIARCPRSSRQSPRLRGATGPRRAASLVDSLLLRMVLGLRWLGRSEAAFIKSDARDACD